MDSNIAKVASVLVRYKGEAPPLPEWPINWSCVGVCIETLSSIDPNIVVEKVNEMRPFYSMAIVDANLMALEEMDVNPPTNLGLKLKSAKAIGDSNWLTPQLLSEVFEARSILDRDAEHRREYQRRIDAAKLCQKNIEEALVQETEARQLFEASLLQLKEIEDKERKVKELIEDNHNITKVVHAEALPTKSKPLIALGGTLSETSSSSTEVKKLLEDKTAQLRVQLQCFENKVKIAQYLDVKGDSEKNHPMTATRIYWCLGFGSSAESICQQVTVKSPFQAIFNLSKKRPCDPYHLLQDDVVLKIPRTIKHGDISIEPMPLPPLIQELLALRLISKLNHPSRKLPIINVLYEDPPLTLENNVEDLAIKLPSKTIGVSPSKKSIQETSGVPYEQIVKAIINATISLKLQFKEFNRLEGNILEKCTIPEAKPSKDVDMTYYKELLDEIPKRFLSIPIIVHSMVAQVSIYECSNEDLQTLKISKANKYLAKGLQNTFQKLGQGLSCMCKPYEILNDLVERIKMQNSNDCIQKAGQNLRASELFVSKGNEIFLKEITNNLQDPAKLLNEESKLLPNDFKRSKSSLVMNKDNFSKLFDPQLSKIIDSTIEDPRFLIGVREAVALTNDISQISYLSKDSSTNTLEDEKHLLIAHEFDKIERLEARVKKPLEYWDSIDVIKVEKFMLSLLACPGKNRACMPKAPFLSEEKRKACLESLKMFASGGSQTSRTKTYPIYKELDDIYGPPMVLEILEDTNGPSFSLVPVNIIAVQRYRKLKMFFEMLLKEDTRVFHTLDSKAKETLPNSICFEDQKFVMDNALNDCQQKELEKEKYLIDCGCPGFKIYQYPTPTEFDQSSKSIRSSKSTSTFPLFQEILDRKLIESISNIHLGDTYGRATTHLPYRVQRYDKDDDSLLEALYADERNHEWKGTVASQMEFGDFVANMDSQLPSMMNHKKHATYDIDEHDGTIFEHFRCHLTEDQGLVWTGLASKSNIQWEPQTTIVKDGNMILTRGYGSNDDSNSPTTKSILATLRDGLIVCFFVAKDGTMSLQITNLENKTIEINSKGVVFMFPSELCTQEEHDEISIDKQIPMSTSIEKENLKNIPNSVTKEEFKQTSREIPKYIDGKIIDEEKDGIISNIQTIKDVLLEEKGDNEVWRCILPTGTVIRFKENGDAQILCRQGNVSNWTSDFEESPRWITTNNQGFLVAQQDPVFQEINLVPLKVSKNLDTQLEETNKPNLMKLDTQLEETKKPNLTKLPDLRVVHFYDPDTGDEILTREDLVVVVTCKEQHSTLVQHADGTHIYSEVKEYFLPEPIEVIIPSKHIYSWPTSCNRDEVSNVEGKCSFKTQNPSKNDNAKAFNASEYNNNIKTSYKDREIDEENGMNIDPKIMKHIDDSKNRDGGYGKKIPLQGLLGEYPNKIGVKLSKFAKAQKTHSETWAPEGYGEIPIDIPKWGWPPQPCGHHLERFSTPPPNEILTSIEHESKTCHLSTIWHVRKDGFAKVHGKIGFGTCIEFETEDGHYIATWAHENSQLTLTMPHGATLHSIGNVVTYSPSTLNKHDDNIEIKISTKKDNSICIEDSIKNENCSQIKKFSQNEDSAQIDDPSNKGPTLKSLNTCGAYVFDMLEGSLIFTNNMGTGFKVFGRGCDFESISNGKLASQQELILKSSTIGINNFQSDHDPNNDNSNVANNTHEQQYFEEPLEIAIKGCDSKTPLEINPNTPRIKEFGRLKLMTRGKQVRKPFDPFDGFDLEPLRTPKSTLTSASSPLQFDHLEPISLGPFPRLFVIQDGGCGYEILAKEMYEIYEIKKIHNKHCTKNDDSFIINDEDCIVHTFVTNIDKVKTNVNELLKDEEKIQSSFPITPWLLTRKISQFARRFEAKQRNNKVQYQTNCTWLQLDFLLPILPHIINPIMPKITPKIENSTFVYRQILETPTILEEKRKNIVKILEAYTNWLMINIGLLQCDIMEEEANIKSDHEIEKEKFIAQCKQEKLSKKKLQKAWEQYKIQVQDARRIICKKQCESAHETFELNRQQKLLQSHIDEDWKLFLANKSGIFQCMHKPTNLLQTKPPFHPLSNIRFLFFHAEEGLQHLFICHQKENEAKQWSLETMSPSSRSSICRTEYFEDFTASEEKELSNMFSRMIEKTEKMLKEVLKGEEDEKIKKEGELFCKQVFSEVLIPKDPFYDFTTEQSNLVEDEQCIFDYASKLELKPKLRPPHVYEFCPTLPPLEPSIIPPSILPMPICLPLQESQVPPGLKIVPIVSPIKPLEIPLNERNKLAREAWHSQRMVEKIMRLNILGPHWSIPNEFDYDYEIYMRAKAFKKAFHTAPWKSNQFYIIRELPNERPMQVQSYERMKLVHDPLPSKWTNRKFRIFPPIIDFHIVQLGTLRMKIVVAQNYHGPRSGRIFIHKEDKLSVKFHYSHGSIAPGMYTMLRVYFRASKLGLYHSKAEIMTEFDVHSITIKAFVVGGIAPLDPDDQIEVVVRNPCNEPIDPWGALILCKRCFVHHLHWWSKNWGLYECTKCWHFHITQSWLDAIVEKVRQEKLKNEAKKENY